MRNIPSATGIAFVAMLLSSASAQAISLNLGGGVNPVIDLGGSETPAETAPSPEVSAGAVVDGVVDLGGGEGTTVDIGTVVDGVVDLGSGDGSTVDVGAAVEGAVDLGGDDGLLGDGLFGGGERTGEPVISLNATDGIDADVNLGGTGNLLDIDGGDAGDGLLDVGSDDAVLGLFGSGAGERVLSVDTDDGVEATVDLGTGTDNEVVVDLFGSGEGAEGTQLVGQVINLGGDAPLVDLGGGDGGLIGVGGGTDTGSGTSGGVLGGVVGGDGAVVDLGSGGGVLDDSPIVSVDGSDGIEADVDLGITGSTGTGGNEPDAVVTLFGGNGEGPEAEVGLLPDVTSPGSDVIIDLFGPSGDGGGGGDGGTDGTGGTGGNGRTGANGGSGGNGADGGDGGNGGVIRPGTGSGVRVAGRTNTRTNCFAPNEQQIGNLLARVNFKASDAQNWQRATSVKVSGIQLCPQSRQQLEAVLKRDQDFRSLQQAVAANAGISAALEPRSASDVLAVMQQNDQLVVYVY